MFPDKRVFILRTMKLFTLTSMVLILLEGENASSVVLQNPVVTLGENASVRGFISYAYQGTRTKPVYTFTGIPFAEKPVRFLKAKPRKLWNGERDATKAGNSCPQSGGLLGVLDPGMEKGKNDSITSVSEDCLFLHVWTPTLDPNSKRDVMVWIHGGGFVFGEGHNYKGTALAALHDVVHVAINYRLAGLGLLTTGDENAPGNMVFHDQLEALRWVKRYIHKFGGDPAKVTIYGESAGSFSVSLHLVSPLSRDLYRRAISESGVSLDIARQTPQRSSSGIALTRRVAKRQGCPTNDNKQMIECLRSKPASAFLVSTDMYGPVMDGSFLLDTPYNLYSTGKINAKEYLLGFNTHEGHMLLNALFTRDLKNITIQSASKMVSLMLYSTYGFNLRILNVLTKEYFGNKTKHDDLYKALVTLFGDYLMVAPSIDVARKHSEKQTTYMYYYTHRMGNPRPPRPDWVLSDHADELVLVLGFPFIKESLSRAWSFNYTTDDEKVSRLLMSYWTNFAKTGNPNSDGLPHWPRYDCKAKKYLKLNKSPSVAADFQPERMKVWTDGIRHLDKTTTYKGFPWTCGGNETSAAIIRMPSAILILFSLLHTICKT